MSQRSLSMLSTVSRVRRGLDNLFDKVMELRGYVPTDGHVNFHNLKCVEHVIRFDFEQLDNPQTCSTIFPPVSFRPMSQLNYGNPILRYADLRTLISSSANCRPKSAVAR
ncbi:hypothetical protein ABZX51_006605 [Aspergillus tubingensis]